MIKALNVMKILRRRIFILTWRKLKHIMKAKKKQNNEKVKCTDREKYIVENDLTDLGKWWHTQNLIEFSQSELSSQHKRSLIVGPGFWGKTSLKINKWAW